MRGIRGVRSNVSTTTCSTCSSLTTADHLDELRRADRPALFPRTADATCDRGRRHPQTRRDRDVVRAVSAASR